MWSPRSSFCCAMLSFHSDKNVSRPFLSFPFCSVIQNVHFDVTKCVLNLETFWPWHNWRLCFYSTTCTCRCVMLILHSYYSVITMDSILYCSIFFHSLFFLIFSVSLSPTLYFQRRRFNRTPGTLKQGFLVSDVDIHVLCSLGHPP